MVATFHLHYLGNRIKYRNREVRSTTQQLFLTTRPCVTYNIEIYICIYIYKVNCIHFLLLLLFLLSWTALFFLHCILNILRYEKMFCEMDESIASEHDPSSDVIFMSVHSESIFHFMEYFFFLIKTKFPLVSLSLVYHWVNQLSYFW